MTGRWRHGLTLIELLIVLAIITVIVAILVPTVASVRRVAMNTVCCSRLRDLAAACNLYRIDYERYPTRLPDASALQLPDPIDTLLPPALLHAPDDIPADLLNELGRYLKYPQVTDQTGALDLPPTVQCPTVEDTETGRHEVLPLSPTGRPLTTFYTGYSYFGRLGEDAGGGGGVGILGSILTILRPDRPANNRNSGSRAVLWADDVHWSAVGAWHYAHVEPSLVEPGLLPLTYATANGLAGQHRAHTDGSVEWVPASDLAIDERNGLSILEQSASLKVGPLFLWWF